MTKNTFTKEEIQLIKDLGLKIKYELIVKEKAELDVNLLFADNELNNVFIKTETKKFPEYSVYSKNGTLLFAEIDNLDNLVAIVSRYISIP